MECKSRGFSLIEIAIAMAVAGVISLAALRLLSSALGAEALRAQRNTEQSALEAMVDRLRIDEDSAWAIFTPALDGSGLPNADGHELDFFARDVAGAQYFWCYDFDASRRVVTRSLFAAPDGPRTSDQTYPGITSFTARTLPVTALADATTPIYSPLFEGASLVTVAIPLAGARYPEVSGGNQITYLRVDTATSIRELELVTQNAPSGATVVLQYTPAPSATP